MLAYIGVSIHMLHIQSHKSTQTQYLFPSQKRALRIVVHISKYQSCRYVFRPNDILIFSSIYMLDSLFLIITKTCLHHTSIAFNLHSSCIQWHSLTSIQALLSVGIKLAPHTTNVRIFNAHFTHKKQQHIKCNIKWLEKVSRSFEWIDKSIIGSKIIRWK